MPALLAWSHRGSAGFTLRGEYSTPSGKPVLHFLHGNGYCGRTYWPMLQILQTDFDIFISDMQGHGDTDHGGRFHGWNCTAELALEAWRAQSDRFIAEAEAVAERSDVILLFLGLSREEEGEQTGKPAPRLRACDL